MKKEYGIALFIITVTGLLSVTLSGSVFSGYHFMDCSGFILWKENLSETSFFECLKNNIEQEMRIRFRPAWHFNSLVRTWLWGDNMLSQGFYQLFLVICAAFLVYLLGRKINWTHGESLLFAGISLIGTQSAIFYQTLAIETTALIVLLLSWHLILSYFNNCEGRRKSLYYYGFAFLSVFMALMKENFILFLPASYLFYCMQYNEKYRVGFWKTILQTWKTGLWLLLLTVGCLWAVLTFAGNDFGYAGMGGVYNLFPYVKTTVYLYGISGCLLSFLIAVYLFRNSRINFKKWLFPILLFSAITFPQIIIYGKSNIIDRYLIPAIMGCAGFSIFVYRKTKQQDISVNTVLWKNASLFLGIVLSIFCGFLVFCKPLQEEIIQVARLLQGEVTQTMTSVSSMQYLLSSLSIIGIFGLITGIVLLIYGLIKNSIRKLSQLCLAGILLVLFMNGGLAFASCKRYAMRGFATENFLKTIIDNSHACDAVLIVGNPYVDMEGISTGISTYLKKWDRNNLFICPITNSSQEEQFIPVLKDFYRQKDINTIENKDEIKVIAVFPGSETVFENTNRWFDVNSFHRYEFTGNYVVFVRNNNEWNN
ncbi:MAG: hypothetical protein LBE71_03115 [Dysgonamonadaceae bacterium]|nr:hypothetical protein [Dysgonamonadaceae bacterium]